MATYKTYTYTPKSTDFRDYLTYKRPTSTYKPQEYSDSDGAYASDIARAQAALNQTLAGKPAAYQSQYSGQISDIIGQMGSRKFDYDVNSDAMFQQLKAIYTEQGKQAMADTQGQAAALTGGYGNSYGVAASQQAYQQSQEQLYDRIPELYQLALSRYQAEGEDLANLYSMYATQDATDYGRHRDTVTDWENERAYRDTALNNLRSQNQSLWAQNESNRFNANAQEWNNYQAAANLAFNQLQHDWDQYQWAEQQTAANRAQAVSEDQWNASFAENQRQYNASLAEQQRQYDQTMAYNKTKEENAAKVAQMESQARIDKFMKTMPTKAMWKSSPYGTGESWESFVERQIDSFNNRAKDDNERLTKEEMLAVYNSLIRK